MEFPHLQMGKIITICFLVLFVETQEWAEWTPLQIVPGIKSVLTYWKELSLFPNWLKSLLLS